MRPDDAHFQSHLGFPFKQYQAAVSLTLADDRIFCFYPKPPLTFSISLGKPAKLHLSFSLRMADAVVHFVPHLFYVQRSYIIFGLSSLNFVVRIRYDELQRTGGLVLATWHAHEYRKFQKYYHGGCFVFEKLQKGEFFYRFLVFILLLKIMTFF